MFLSREQRCFDKCRNKDVEFLGNGTPSDAYLQCPYIEDNNLKISASSDGHDSLKLFNRKVNNRGNFLNQKTAYKELAEIAGAIACGNCPYSRMSKTEVAEIRRKNAEEELRTKEAERNRLRAVAFIGSVEADIRKLKSEL